MLSSNARLFAITFVATLGGLLFGYDTAVISGAIGPLGDYFSLSDVQVGWAASCALLGCAIGAIVAGQLSHRFGRKPTLAVAAVCYTISAIGSAVPESFVVFIMFRVLGGIGVGIASMVSPMYIAEIAPARLRGRMVALNQFAIVIGIVTVYFVNYYIGRDASSEWLTSIGWRYMLASEFIPAAMFLLLLSFVPESPRWYMLRGLRGQAETVLKRLLPSSAVDKEVADIERSLTEQHAPKRSTKAKVWYPSATVIMIGVALSIFQQATGINVFLYYAPEIFKDFGSGDEAALWQTVLVGSVNMLATIFAILTVDRLGRRPLLIWGSAGMALCLFAIGKAAYDQNIGPWLLGFVLGYIACFAFSLGPVVWVLLAEIFPNRLRSKGLAIAVFAQWIANFIISQTFPMLNGNAFLNTHLHGAFPFWLYGGMCLVTIVFTLRFVPETKGQKLEDIERFWSSSTKFQHKRI